MHDIVPHLNGSLHASGCGFKEEGSHLSSPRGARQAGHKCSSDSCKSVRCSGASCHGLLHKKTIQVKNLACRLFLWPSAW